MNGRQTSYVFFFIITVAITAVSADVSIWDTTVTLTCPDVDSEEKVTWYKEGTKISTETNQLTIDDYSDKKNDVYYCTYPSEPKRHYFFIKAKVCKGCVDLNMWAAFLLVITDVLVTLGIVFIVYVCARKKDGSAPPQRATQPRQARGQARGPTPPEPDYQPLNPNTRSNDVYAQAHRK